MAYGVYRNTSQNQNLKQSIDAANHEPDNHSNQRDINNKSDIAGFEQIDNAVDSIIDGRHTIAPFAKCLQI